MNNHLTEPLDDFKERELEILALMASGASNQEIADQLFITKGTVRWYNKQIYSKLGTSRRTEAIALAREMGLIESERPTETDSSPSLQHKLPITTGPFIGREHELAEISELIGNPDIRLVSLIAAGGMGKSRLSLELGHLIKNNFEHGAVFIDLTPIRNHDDIATITVTSLGLSVEANQSPQEVLINYCREKSLLLIFDNFEDVLSGASLLTRILEGAPSVKIIATSRERLNLRAETTYYLQPVHDAGDQLFIEVASTMHTHVDIGEDELSDVQRIVELVGGLPLALVLAATWLDTLSVAEIVEEIEANLDFLSSDLADMPDRQRSIHAVIEPTWKRLSEKEKKAFMWISVFRGGFTRETFREATGATARTLQTLLNRSLITHGHGRRYDMHPLLRQYAREKLELQGMLQNAKQAHLQTFLAYATYHDERRLSGEYLDSLAQVDVEQDNFRSALDWSLAGHDTETGIALVITLSQFWIDRSQIKEAQHYFELALTHDAHNPALYARASFCHYRIGQMETAKEYIQNAIELAQQSDNDEILANSYRILSMVSSNLSRENIAHLFEKAFTHAEKSGSERALANLHMTWAMELSGSDVEAEIILQQYHKALSYFEAVGDLQAISRTVYNMAIEYYRASDNERARELVEYSLDLKRQIGDQAGIARRLSALATWDILEEGLERADQYLAESLLITERLGEKSRLRYTLFMQAMLYLIKGEYGKSQTRLARSLEIAIEQKNTYWIEVCHSNMGMLYLLQNKLTQAKDHIVQGIEAIRDTNLNPWASIMVYANYLWFTQQYESCTPITAMMSLYIEDYELNYNIMNRYFARPLIYRMQNHLGEDAWQEAQSTVGNTTIQQLFQDILHALDVA